MRTNASVHVMHQNRKANLPKAMLLILNCQAYSRAFLYWRQFGFFRVEPLGEGLRKSLYYTYLLLCCNMSIIVENAKKGTGGKIITSNFYVFMLTSVYATSLSKNYLLFSELVCTGNEIWQSIQRSDNNNKELFLKIFVSFFVNTYSKNQKISLHPCLNTPIV